MSSKTASTASDGRLWLQMVGFLKEQATKNQTQVACEEMREFLMQTAK